MTDFFRGHKTFFLNVGLCAVILLALYPLLNAGFVGWDESDYIVNNPLIKKLSWSNFAEIFLRSDLKLYTPLTTFSFALDHFAGGDNPAVYHAVNLLLHMANSVLVFFIIRALGLGPAGAWLGAALFGVHPAHVESVAWVAERKDVLCAFFFFSSLLLYLKSAENGKKRFYCASVFCFVLAVLAKPMAVTLPVILILCDWFKGRAAGGLKNKIPYFIVSAISVCITMLPRFLYGGDVPPEAAFGAGVRVLSPMYAWVFYVFKMFWPVNLSGMYELSGGLRGIGAYAALFLAIWTLILVTLRRSRTLMFGIIFFTVALLPVIQLVPFGPVLTADRYTYIPYFGLFFAVAAVVERWLDKTAVKALVLAVLALFVFASNVRCRVWMNPLVFWQDVASKNAKNPSVYINLSNAHLSVGQYAQAEAVARRAIAIDPARPNAHINLSICRMYARDTDGALAALENARVLRPDSAFVYANMAVLYFQKRDRGTAFSYLEKAVSLEPKNTDFLKYLAAERLKDCASDECRSSAAAGLIRVLEINPSDSSARNMLCGPMKISAFCGKQ
ncbi:MAG: hypothetical protein WCS77_06585 [Elusimicrobiaceae bacterium]